MSESGAGIDRLILDFLGCVPAGGSIRALGNAGGFSGARLWRVAANGTVYCLRCWPHEFQDGRRLRWIHEILLRVSNSGIRFIPRPVPSQTGETVVGFAGHLWDMAPWLPGQANYHTHPSNEKLESALQSLARFHDRARVKEKKIGRTARSPGIQYRLQRIDYWMAGRLDDLVDAIQRSPITWLEPLGARLVDLFREHAPRVKPRLMRASVQTVPISPCIRDIWHDHVLFTGEKVTGIIDFGAMREENVASDIARLIGSLAQDDSSTWVRGLDAYQHVRRLSDDELELIRAFDLGNVLLSGMQWLEWLYLENRTFNATETVCRRISEWADRLAGIG